jgi:hypothetical protein
MDASYLEFCTTDTQRKVLNAVISEGSNRKAAKAISTDLRSLERTLARIRLAAATRGFSPAHDMTHPTPATHALKGTSTLYNRNGDVTQQWVKTERVTENLADIIRAIADGMIDEIPKAAPVKAPTKKLNADLQNLFVVTDYHLGMLAWGEECGEDWDLAKAEDTLYRWFEAAIIAAPDAESAIFAQLGDFLHWDGLDAVTPTSKHILDADTRFQKVVRVAIRVIRRIITLLLSKHKHLTIIMADANHDPAAGVWMREWLAHLYDDEPRVTVDNSPDTYYCVQFGKVANFFHHGHKRDIIKVDTIFVAKFRWIYGATEYHYAHGGHLHHDRVIESNLMHSEQHATIAPKDAYASRNGYMSKRSAKVITYHKTYGEVSRVTIRPEMLR